METLNVKINYSGVDINAKFTNKINMLSGYSGTGKTFLMEAVELYCLNNQIRRSYCDFRCMNLSDYQIKTLCENAEVVILDNADLYLTNDIMKWLKENKKFLIICMKKTSKIDMRGITEYLVRYENRKLTIEEL